MTRYLFVVSRRQPDLHLYLYRKLRDEPDVHVLLDRRVAERRGAIAERTSAGAERRTHERRQNAETGPTLGALGLAVVPVAARAPRPGQPMREGRPVCPACGGVILSVHLAVTAPGRGTWYHRACWEGTPASR